MSSSDITGVLVTCGPEVKTVTIKMPQASGVVRMVEENVTSFEFLSYLERAKFGWSLPQVLIRQDGKLSWPTDSSICLSYDNRIDL